MPETESKLPEEDRMESASEGLRRQEGIGRQRGDHAGPGSSGQGSRRQRGDQHDSGGGTGRSRGEHQDSDGLYNEGGDKQGEEKRRSGSELDEDEEAAAGLYNDDGTPESGWRRKMVKRYWKRAAFGGGIAGLTVTGLVMFLSVAQGPLEFVHLAQLLEKFHFASLEDAQDGRLMKIVRYIHDPSKPERTRLGIVGNIAADHLETKINEATGLESKYNSDSGRFEGYEVIKDNPHWEGKNTAAIKSELVDRGIDPSNIQISVSSNGEQSIKFNPDPGGWNSIKRYRAQTAFARELLREGGYSKLASHVGSRVLKARAGWDFHPIRALDKAIQAKALEAGKKGYRELKDKLKTQFNQQEATYEATGDTAKKPGGDPQAEKGKDSKGNPVDIPQADAEAQGAKDLANEADKLNPTDENSKAAFTDHLSARIAGGGVGLIGIACVVRNLSSSIDGLRFAKVILPMMRKAGKIISLGSQVQAGQDIDTTSLGVLKDAWLDTTDAASGAVTSTWNQARSIQAENGLPLTGPDLPKSDQVFNKGNPFNVFDNIPALGTACGALESTFGQIFSIVTGPVSYVVTGEVLKHVLPALAGWLSGAPLNPIASGAEFGNIVNYGARLSANDQFAGAGGVPLNHTQTVTLKQVDSSLDQKDFASKSIAYRVFNTTDSRTLAAHLIDNQDLKVPNNVASMLSGLGHMFASALKMPAMLFTGRADAASQTYSYHGLKKVGFSASDLGDPRFDDPFKNACYVVGCPNAKPHPITGIFANSHKEQMYTDRAQKCFGVNITNDSGTWNIDSLTQAVNVENKDYPESDCQSSDLDWLRVRFWILDSSTMDGYACFAGIDDQSCADLGINSATSSGSSSVAGASGNAQQLAQAILNNKKIDLSYSSSILQDVKDAAAGKKGTAGVLTSTALLQLIVTLGENHSVVITAIQSDGQGHCNNTPKSGCPTDPHYNGDAVDFGALDGVTITGRNAPALTIIKVAEQLLPKGSGFGQESCGTHIDMPAGFTQFNDTCNHLHVQVPKGTQ